MIRNRIESAGCEALAAQFLPHVRSTEEQHQNTTFYVTPLAKVDSPLATVSDGSTAIVL